MHPVVMTYEPCSAAAFPVSRAFHSQRVTMQQLCSCECQAAHDHKKLHLNERCTVNGLHRVVDILQSCDHNDLSGLHHVHAWMVCPFAIVHSSLVYLTGMLIRLLHRIETKNIP